LRAGLKSFSYPNVVNMEIVPYASTDAVGVGQSLPFPDDTFDAVLSIAVLEHVNDPFLCARELIRVLKPGGRLMCAVPFLQPEHGYPHHYFNMTRMGLAELFKGGGASCGTRCRTTGSTRSTRCTGSSASTRGNFPPRSRTTSDG